MVIVLSPRSSLGASWLFDQPNELWRTLPVKWLGNHRMNSKRSRSGRRQRRRKFLFSLCVDNVPYSSVVVLMMVFVLAIIPCAMPLVVRQSSVIAFDGGGLQSRSPPLRRRFRRRRLRPSRADPSTLLLAHPVRKNDLGGQKRTEEDSASSVSSSSPRLSSLDYNPNDSATSMQDESVDDNDELSSIKRTVLTMLRRNEMKQALDSIRFLVVSLGQKNDFDDGKYRLRASQCVDEMIQALTRQAFAPLSSSYYRNTNSNQRQAARHVQWGVDALHLQLQSSSRLADPYHLVPKMTLVNALKALTRLNEINPQLHVSSPSLKIKNQPKPQQQQRQQKNDDFSLDDDSGPAVDASSSPYFSSTSTSSTWTAFRILQRLITGVGVRKQTTTPPPPLHQQQQKPNKRYFVYESDINMVLNAFSDAGQMDMAHRIVALQERTQHAPPLSPVAYSILLKGYGRLSDLHHVQLVVQHAEKNDIQPDVILLNSLIDAYINCNALDKAKAVFDQMRLSPSPSTTTSATGTEVNETTVEMNDKNRVLFINHPCPLPNKRTYNTILKGLANAGLLQEAMALADEMQRCRIWDDVSSNTMVHAAVLAGDLALAEQLLKKHAAAATAMATLVGQSNSSNSLKKNNKHPNVEAYTELLDGYAKAGQMANALSVLQRMRQHHIEPNQITYTCLIAGFGRSGRVKEAIKLVEFMSNSSDISNSRSSSNSRSNIRPTIVTFNALISGLLAGPQCATAADSSLSSSLLPQTSQECSPLEVESLDSRVDEALGIVRLMMKMGVPPNTVTVSTIIHAMGRCGTPRVKEAMMLVEKLERQSVIPFANAQVATNLIRACGIGNDLKGAVTAFRKLKTPDVIAINAFMDACCRCDRADLAVGTFGFYFRHKDGDEQNKREADVVSYSVLISWFIKSGSTENLEAAMKYYGEMKTESLIRPDNTLVDIILKGMIRVGRSKNLSKRDVYFVASVLRDAKKLNWAEGQLERRQRAARAALTQQFRNDEVFLYSILQVDDDDDDDDDDDELFQRKGWNKVDSGFRLWGGGYSEAPEAKKRRSSKVVDIFLQKKGWNNVDSGFRIL